MPLLGSAGTGLGLELGLQLGLIEARGAATSAVSGAAAGAILSPEPAGFTDGALGTDIVSVSRFRIFASFDGLDEEGLTGLGVAVLRLLNPKSEEMVSGWEDGRLDLKLSEGASAVRFAPRSLADR